VPAGKHHTLDSTDDKKAAMNLINTMAERAAEGACGLKVRPSRGSACVFYSMAPNGSVDSNSYHFGASITAPCAGKWTLQFFKELPLAARSPAGRKAYAAEYHPLRRVQNGETQQPAELM
jgi:hypothetical protein